MRAAESQARARASLLWASSLQEIARAFFVRSGNMSTQTGLGGSDGDDDNHRNAMQ